MEKKSLVRIILGFFIFLTSFLFWLVLWRALQNGPDWLNMALWSLVIFLVFGSFVGLAYLIEKEKKFLYAVPLLVVLPFLIFYQWEKQLGLIVVAVAILFFVLAIFKVEFEKSLRIKLAAGIILRKGLAPTITALALLITLFFYWAPYTQSLEQEISVPRPLFDAIVKPVINIFMQTALPPGTNQKALSAQLNRQQQESMDILYQTVNEQLDSAGKSYKKWIPLGLSVSLFFSFKIIGTFLSWLMVVLAMVQSSQY